ncbi:uncharacterized protein B0H18DRAFT_889991, partial [Fomitopsis serialis]|uniref:uncharacterized protein n=1 Tax=Fomitopsis serialis TaxID=139415 RepID=UPI002007ADA1
GTIYALVLVALRDLRTKIAKSVGNFAYQLGNVLCRPDPSTAMGQIIIERIIPAVESLRQRIPLRFDTVFSSNLLTKLQLPSDSLLCTDLEQSDRMFSSLKLKCVTTRFHLGAPADLNLN